MCIYKIKRILLKQTETKRNFFKERQKQIKLTFKLSGISLYCIDSGGGAVVEWLLHVTKALDLVS